MGPPRLSVVESSGEIAKPAHDGPTATAAMPANDAAPVDPGIGQPISGSPVHDLIEAIEEGTSAALRMPPGGEQAEVATGAQPAGPTPERREKLRILEAVIFASGEPLDEARLASYLKTADASEVADLLVELQSMYAGRGVSLVRIASKWAFRTAEDLSWVLERHARQERRLSKAALETLAIVAYHQPVTRAEIEDVRGVTISKGTLDVLMEAGWVRPRGRRRAPGKPITYGTTDQFLEHFGLESVKDLPGLADLKASGLLDANLPPDFKMPEPKDAAALMPDELPLDEGGEDDEPLQTELDLDPEEIEADEAKDQGESPGEESEGGDPPGTRRG